MKRTASDKLTSLLRKNAGQRFTAIQLAAKLGVSKVTIYKILKTLTVKVESKKGHNARGPKPDVYFF